ncbi:Crp/Fnr family transcriptional regulator [Variovorax sp. J22R133]|uniref:Crp/Fnr family transcriptional regulator n=1 Tax=Variovorax brevis TaxID=3053503 RepID=UPI002574E845|nr:Crp/Fnr family transcriptional regulator [Variovorax sp. J22R133]MDM0112847.1 Crp/Fnr family transcriptional regulator [Variovorax sp. J22R133]
MQAMQIELLQQMPIFGAVSESTLEFLLAPAQVFDVPAGQYFFREGDAASGMFVLEHGRVAVRKQWERRDMLLRELGRGDCFGEMALLDLSARSASVVALEDCHAIELTPDNLFRLFELDPGQFALIQMNIAREMSRRLRYTDEMLFRARMEEVNASLEEVFRWA